MTFETLHKLEEIFQNHEKACDIEGVFANYKEDKSAVVLMSIDDYKEFYGIYPVKRYPINSALDIPSELIQRIRKVINEYENEMYNTLNSVKVDNLPWEKELTNEM